MFSEIAVVCCAVLALQATIGYCLPSGKTTDFSLDSNLGHWSKKLEEDEKDDSGYQVILKSSQFLKVEVVGEGGNISLQELQVDSHEDDDVQEATPIPTTTLPPSTTETQNRPTKRKIHKRRLNDGNKISKRKQRTYRCDWRRLFKLYLSSRKVQSQSFTTAKRREIRRAFKVVCENPEDAIELLLEMD